MNEYQKIRERQQKEFDSFPLGFAFSNDQFERMMKNWGLDAKNDSDLKKIVHIESGAFVQKKDLDRFHDMINRQEDELQAAISADKTGEGFIREMFDYELRNHEYGYTGSVEDTLDCLGYTWKDIEKDSCLRHGLELAAHQIMIEEA